MGEGEDGSNIVSASQVWVLRLAAVGVIFAGGLGIAIIFLDRELFQELLEEGWRPATYLTNSSVSRQFYGEHQVYFYYLNVGAEIARVEIPQWVAQDERLLALGHSLILDQCRRGQGYPVALSEAHEQAVINGAERQLFKRMVAETLERQGLRVYTSERERSKRTPGL